MMNYSRLQILCIVVITAMFMLGCNGFSEKIEASDEMAPRFAEEELINQGNIRFDEESGRWVREIVDPYTLENFKRARLNLIEGKSPYSDGLTFGNIPEVSTTHLHIKIYPKSVKEIDELYGFKDVVISSYPFNTNLITEEEAESMGLEKLEVIPNMGTGKKHIEHPEPAYVNDVLVEQEPLEMPVLFAVWPVVFPIPEDMDYELLYEVFIPETEVPAKSINTESDKSDKKSKGCPMDILEQEAIRLSKGTGGISSRANASYYPNGRIIDTDPIMGQNYGVPFIKIRLNHGSKTSFTYTDYQGYYRFYTYWDTATTVTVVTEHDMFRMTDSDRRTLELKIGNIKNGGSTIFGGSYWINAYLGIIEWFFEDHGLWASAPGRIIIRYLPKYTGPVTSLGEFWWNDKDQRVTIYEHPGSTGIQIFNTTVHELSHAGMFAHKGYNNFNTTSKTVKESWARFVQWHLTEEKYRKLGYLPSMRTIYLPNSPLRGFCTSCDLPYMNCNTHYRFNRTYPVYMDRQDWKKTDTIYIEYSPIFIDLRDSFNQREFQWYSNNAKFKEYPNDRIGGTPLSYIQDLAYGSKTRGDVWSKMAMDIGIRWSRVVFDDFWEGYPSGAWVN